jgi:RNA polymerase sigma-70 factor (ECF subfamily)
LPLKARRHAQNLVFVEFAALAPSDQEDVRLMLAAQRQVAGAFDELYIRHYGVVYRRARRLVRDAHEAHDIAQQVFESLFSQLEHYQPRVDVPIRALLMTITRRTALRQHRKSRVFEALDPWEVRLKREFAADGTIDPTEPGWIADGSLLREIERLPTRQRQVLSLRFLFDLSDADIAEVLDLTPVAVRKSLHRAMKALRARLPQRETPRRAPGSDQREPLAVSRLVRFSPVLAGRRLALAG